MAIYQWSGMSIVLPDAALAGSKRQTSLYTCFQTNLVSGDLKKNDDDHTIPVDAPNSQVAARQTSHIASHRHPASPSAIACHRQAVVRAVVSPRHSYQPTTETALFRTNPSIMPSTSDSTPSIIMPWPHRQPSTQFAAFAFGESPSGYCLQASKCVVSCEVGRQISLAVSAATRRVQHANKAAVTTKPNQLPRRRITQPPALRTYHEQS